jgi:hypothetical protein
MLKCLLPWQSPHLLMLQCTQMWLCNGSSSSRPGSICWMMGWWQLLLLLLVVTGALLMPNWPQERSALEGAAAATECHQQQSLSSLQGIMICQTAQQQQQQWMAV